MADEWPEDMVLKAKAKQQSSIDDKLALIIMGLPDPDGGISEGDMEDGIAQIKQAFADEGYVQEPRTFDVHGRLKINGQEFYARFEKELAALEYEYRGGAHPDGELWQIALKRAAGITEAKDE